MKKFFVFAMAALALTFVGCKEGKTDANADGVDSTQDTTAVVEAAAADPAAAISALTEQIEAKDVTAFQAALDKVKAQIQQLLAKDPETAKTYLAKVQEFLKTNADKIKAFAGNNAAVSSAVAAFTDADTDKVLESIKTAVGVEEAAKGAVDAAKGQVDAAVDAAKGQVDAAKEKVDAAKEAVKAAPEAAKEAANKAAGQAVDKAASDIKKGLGIK